jgi:hypothetical protein
MAQEYSEIDQAGKYYADPAESERLQAGRRVLGDASALKNEMLNAFNGNIVLWGDGGPNSGGGGGLLSNGLLGATQHNTVKASGSSEDLQRRAPHRLGPAGLAKGESFGKTFSVRRQRVPLLCILCGGHPPHTRCTYHPHWYQWG